MWSYGLGCEGCASISGSSISFRTERFWVGGNCLSALLSGSLGIGYKSKMIQIWYSGVQCAVLDKQWYPSAPRWYILIQHRFWPIRISCPDFSTRHPFCSLCLRSSLLKAKWRDCVFEAGLTHGTMALPGRKNKTWEGFVNLPCSIGDWSSRASFFQPPTSSPRTRSLTDEEPHCRKRWLRKAPERLRPSDASETVATRWCHS